MLYWLGAYTLVVIVALVPFFLLYVLSFLVWLILTAIRFMIRSVNNVPARRTFRPKRLALIHGTHRGYNLRSSHQT